MNQISLLAKKMHTDRIETLKENQEALDEEDEGGEDADGEEEDGDADQEDGGGEEGEPKLTPGIASADTPGRAWPRRQHVRLPACAPCISYQLLKSRLIVIALS